MFVGKLLCATLLCLIALASSQPLDTRLVNGNDADITQYPFMVTLRFPYGSYICAGTLLNPKWVLTAGVCIRFNERSIRLVQYGVTEDKFVRENTVAVKRVFKHEDYSGFYPYHNDIGMVEVMEPIMFNARVSAVKLPEAGLEFPVAQIGRLVGWGSNSSNGSEYPGKLQVVDMDIIDLQSCEQRTIWLHDLESTQFCTAPFTPSSEDYRGQCNGDTGGPVMYHDNSQVGIISFRRHLCGQIPAVSTKVSKYIGWINKKMKLYS